MLPNNLKLAVKILLSIGKTCNFYEGLGDTSFRVTVERTTCYLKIFAQSQKTTFSLFLLLFSFLVYIVWQILKLQSVIQIYIFVGLERIEVHVLSRVYIFYVKMSQNFKLWFLIDWTILNNLIFAKRILLALFTNSNDDRRIPLHNHWFEIWGCANIFREHVVLSTVTRNEVSPRPS